MEKYILLFSVVLALVFLGVLELNETNESPCDSIINTSAFILIENFSYNPDNITLKKGTNVRWLQKDSVRHSVTSDEGIFDSGLLSKGVSFEYTFYDVGVYNYHSKPHQYVKGTIFIVD
ncbi:plastocyanin/azurin family copper-binding protein [Methanococcus vannielii]|uniref:plastocyanin/azurin family copper-binding protein n=1 Tax=Methanococcus vannielii TaxID=2187 RepID=UPI0012EAE863|nr:plastocyanin/azurin family copper-binding protein [Methanococcus vannielii]